MQTHKFPYAVDSGVVVDPALVELLIHRESDWRWNEEGYALSEQIFRFPGPISMHTDDAAEHHLTYGFVFTTDPYWLVQMEQAYEIKQGSVYMLEPTIIHGALNVGGPSLLIAYIVAMTPREAHCLSFQQFAERAIGAAWRLVQSPAPPDE